MRTLGGLAKPADCISAGQRVCNRGRQVFVRESWRVALSWAFVFPPCLTCGFSRCERWLALGPFGCFADCPRTAALNVSEFRLRRIHSQH